MTYSEQMRSPLWQKKRLEILSRDGFMCEFCQSTETQLHVHHKRYARNRKAWEYPDDNFATLCENCHAGITLLGNDIKAMLHFEPAFSMFELCMKEITNGDWCGFYSIMKYYHENRKKLSALSKKIAKEESR